MPQTGNKMRIKQSIIQHKTHVDSRIQYHRTPDKQASDKQLKQSINQQVYRKQTKCYASLNMKTRLK